ncbi:unnamed protein product [Clonostachys chloroleuca]|uniref:L-asparaginase n=1 Tax=Clonostachys chloroleuca TaxID=1926264 RepID=A0AA35M4N8_9HYPO|nr:unnamed protein product [Clonostachys chloroleuca]
MEFKQNNPGPSPKLKPRLIIHGGAGNVQRDTFTPEKYELYRTTLLAIVSKTAAYIDGITSDGKRRPRPSALEIATHAVVQLEDSPLFNSGHGAVFTRDGINELEASVMVSHGRAKRGVGVMGLRRVRNPILLARRMLEEGDKDLAPKMSSSSSDFVTTGEGDFDVPSAQGHTQIYGETAEQLARQYGLDIVDKTYFFTQQRWDEHVRALEKEKLGKGGATWSVDEYLPQGTCGAVAMDEDGVVCAATSTGGLTNKLTGRVGDTPVPGAGFWAEEWEEEGAPPSSWDISKAAVTSYGSPFFGLSDSLRGLVADCLPTPFLYSPVSSKLPATGTVTTRSMGVSGTGNGDSFLRTNAARTVAAIARFKPESTAKALANVAGTGGELQRSAGSRFGKTGEGEGGMIAIESIVSRDSQGRIVDASAEVLMDFNCAGMFRAWVDDDGKPVMSIWSRGAEDGFH